MNRNSRSLISRVEAVLMACALLGGMAWAALMQPPKAGAAEAPPPAAVCSRLSAEESPDKNYYVFRASAAAADGATINAYTFSFGDKQTYTFNFPKDASDRSMTTVNHTYLKAGTYTASASVQVTRNNKKSTITSKSCSVQIVIEQGQVNELVSAGPAQNVSAFSATAMLGMLYWRRKTLRSLLPRQ